MRFTKLIGPLLVIATALPCGAQATRALGKPEAEFAEPFTQLVGVRELKDGRVIAADLRDKVIHLIDFKSGKLSKIGREGSGPKEFGMPMALTALPGDTSLIYDPLNQRILMINPDGTPGEFITPSGGASTGAAGMTMRLAAPSFADARGRLYSAAPNIRVGTGGGVESADSSAILRWDRSTGKTDTVGYLRVPKSNTQVTSGGSGGQRTMSFRVGAGNPFDPRDSWFVTPDGRVGVIRSPEYRVDWVSPQKSTGTPIAFSPMKVSEAHKKQWRDTRQNSTAIMITNNNGQRSATSGGAGMQLPEPTDWPEMMPPFLSSSRPLVAPNGNVWVRRTTEASEKRTMYDVLDATGKIVERVALPPRSTIAGFGNGTMYTLRLDEDDLQYLQRHRMK